MLVDTVFVVVVERGLRPIDRQSKGVRYTFIHFTSEEWET